MSFYKRCFVRHVWTGLSQFDVSGKRRSASERRAVSRLPPDRRPLLHLCAAALPGRTDSHSRQAAGGLFVLHPFMHADGNLFNFYLFSTFRWSLPTFWASPSSSSWVGFLKHLQLTCPPPASDRYLTCIHMLSPAPFDWCTCLWVQLESRCADLDPELAAALSMQLDPHSPEMDFLWPAELQPWRTSKLKDTSLTNVTKTVHFISFFRQCTFVCTHVHVKPFHCYILK